MDDFFWTSNHVTANLVYVRRPAAKWTEDLRIVALVGCGPRTTGRVGILKEKHMSSSECVLADNNN